MTETAAPVDRLVGQWVCFHCPIMEQTADGVTCGRCWFALSDNVCRRHGNVMVEVQRFQSTGKCTLENEMRKRKGLILLGDCGS